MIWDKIKGWMAKILFSMGKDILIKSVAQSIRVYSMSCFRLPRGISESVTSLITQFYWRAQPGKRKPAWVVCGIVALPKELGPSIAIPTGMDASHESGFLKCQDTQICLLSIVYTIGSQP